LMTRDGEILTSDLTKLSTPEQIKGESQSRLKKSGIVDRVNSL